MGALVAVVAAMLALGGAIGFFGGPLVLDGDDDTEVTADATGVPTEPTPTTAAPDPNAWAVPNSFQVSMPAGWTAGSDKYSAGQFGLVARPSGPNADAFEAGGLLVSFDRRPGRTPESEFERPLPEKCTAGEATPWSYKDLTGLSKAASACPNGFDYLRIAVTLPGGSLLIVSSAQMGLDEAVVHATIDSFKPVADASTQVAPQAGCGVFDPSSDPEYPLLLKVKNHLDATVNFGYLNDRNEVVNDHDLQDGYTTGTNYAKVGDVFRATKADGTTVDYTTTDAATQCVILNDTGFVPVL